MPSGLEHISPDLAAAIAANAQALGLSIDEYLWKLLNQQDLKESVPPRERVSTSQFEEFLDDLASGESPEPSTYHGTYSRDDIYFNHD